MNVIDVQFIKCNVHILPVILKLVLIPLVGGRQR